MIIYDSIKKHQRQAWNSFEHPKQHAPSQGTRKDKAKAIAPRRPLTWCAVGQLDFPIGWSCRCRSHEKNDG